MSGTRRTNTNTLDPWTANPYQTIKRALIEIGDGIDDTVRTRPFAREVVTVFFVILLLYALRRLWKLLSPVKRLT